MHNTGRVSTKTELSSLLARPENKRLASARGRRMGITETCYETAPKPGDKSLESQWRCDFGQLRALPPAARGELDVLMGHQYWKEGCDDMFGPTRDVRYFSIFRHPLPRKLSFFYHFFVRNYGRDEASVDKDEVIRFVLGETGIGDPRMRDAGPNYYASRLLSNGLEGFVAHRFAPDDADAALADVLARLERRFVMVGLQMQSEASQCMLQKLVQVFVHAHGIDTMVGTTRLGSTTLKKNSGSYTWTAQKLWKVMTKEQRRKYGEVERMDLAIYEWAVRRFRRDVERYTCAAKVVKERFGEDEFLVE